MSQSKLCYKCKNEKKLTEFNRSQYDKDGHRNICRDCRNTHRAIVRKHKKHYEVLLEKQNNCCAICGKSEEENGQRLAIDHNHTTHQVRALLCRSCNTGLGAFIDNQSLMSKAIEYLNTWGGNDGDAKTLR
jgi:hypothetical protein